MTEVGGKLEIFPIGAHVFVTKWQKPLVHCAEELQLAQRANNGDAAFAALGATIDETIGKAINEASPTFLII